MLDKYLALAQDASSSGDRVTAEAFLQHAEHYFRILHLEGENGAPNGGQGRPNQPARTPESVGGDPTEDREDSEPSPQITPEAEPEMAVAEVQDEKVADPQPAS